MIIGIGVDMVDIGRFEASLRRTPALAARLFAESERRGRPESLAASFAAKEAVAKALGAPTGRAWTGLEVVRAGSGGPRPGIRRGRGIVACIQCYRVARRHQRAGREIHGRG